jgi:predicted exporter
MLPLRGVADAAALGNEIPAVPGAEAILLDIKHASDALYQAYRREALRNALLGAGAILVLLLVALRSLRRLLDVTVPLVAAVAVTTSAVLLTGTPLSIFHLVGLLLVVAVGSNYSLFFDRQAAGAADRERTLVSLVFANVTTVIGFGLLSFSQVPVLRAIGFTVAIGAVLSLVFAAILGDRSRR